MSDNGTRLTHLRWMASQHQQFRCFFVITSILSSTLVCQLLFIYDGAIFGDEHSIRTYPSLSTEIGQTLECYPKLFHLIDHYFELRHGEHIVVPHVISRNSKNWQRELLSSQGIHRSSQNKDDCEHITVTVQLDASRLNRFLFFLQRWNGPTSATVYLTSIQEIKIFLAFVANHSAGEGPLGRLADVHVLLAKTKPGLEAKMARELTFGTKVASQSYPHNLLRQAALDHTPSCFVLVLDVDLMPPMHANLLQFLKSNKALQRRLRQHQTMAVLPAFNRARTWTDADLLRDEVAFPTTRKDTLAMLALSELSEFRTSAFRPGHRPTDYGRWYGTAGTPPIVSTSMLLQGSSNLNLSSPSSSTFYSVNFEERYEPYVLVYRGDHHVGALPKYWGAFRGFVYDKNSWFMDAHYMGYSFVVLSTFFVVHLDHHDDRSNGRFDSFQNSLETSRYIDYLQKRDGLVNNKRFVRRVYRPIEFPKRKHPMQNSSKMETVATYSFIEKENTSYYQSDGNVDYNSTLIMKWGNSWRKLITLWSQLGNESFAAIPNALPRVSMVESRDITVTVHLSISKWQRLCFLLKRWDGPASVSIYLRNTEDIEKFATLINLERSGGGSNSPHHRSVLRHATFHLFLHKTSYGYPHNKLREMALRNTESEFFLTLDVDFVTVPHCYHQLRALMFGSIGRNIKIANLVRNKTLIVLPAFNLERRLIDFELDDGLLPNSRPQAIKMVQQSKISAFHMKQFPAGHGPTEYRKWYKTRSLDEDSSGNCFYFIEYFQKFEPYVLGYQKDAPTYWPAFRGFGFDKFSWFLEAHYSGLKFAVIKDFFVLHLDHGYTSLKIAGHNVDQMAKFVSYLISHYGAPAADFEQDFVIQNLGKHPDVFWRPRKRKNGMRTKKLAVS